MALHGMAWVGSVQHCQYQVIVDIIIRELRNIPHGCSSALSSPSPTLLAGGGGTEGTAYTTTSSYSGSSSNNNSSSISAGGVVNTTAELYSAVRFS
jgi:hypothetical protein